ncbi:MAG: helix-turn-helix transcriptional regulator [Clostridiales bacterium]|nr:helix-turn-helix transcriptional regulator [Clostridiales bacterium]
MIRILPSTRLGERQWTQAHLAKVTGIRPSTISDLYNEMTDRVNLKQLDIICDALGCELSDLIVREPTPNHIELYREEQNARKRNAGTKTSA